MKTTCLQLSAAIFAWMLAEGASLAAWQKLAIGVDWREASVNAIQIGPGRNDGILRVYSALADNSCYGYGAVAEHSYTNGAWTNVILWDFIPETSPCGDRRGTGVAVGAARYDGVNRVYACHNENFQPYAGAVMDEFTYSAGQWNELSTQCAYNSDSVALLLGDGRNDGKVRVYQASGPITNAVGEFTYAFGAFATTNIASLPSGIRSMALASGRNDGWRRIYTANEDGSVYELSFTNGMWSQNAISVVPASLRSIAVGSGRNDGLQRLYVGCLDSHIYELTYRGSNWATVDLGYGGDSMKGVALGPGRNDGVTRVYGSCYDSHMYEFSYAGGSWQKSDVGTGTGAMLCVTVGPGRSDGVVRVYGGNADANIYEFSYSTPNPPPPAPTAYASDITTSGFTANWSASSGATGYRLDVSTNSAFSSYVSLYQDLDMGNATNKSVTGLRPNEMHYYQVRATNSNGASPNSNRINVTTQPSVVVQPSTVTTNSGATVTFTAVAPGAQPVSYQWFFNNNPLAGTATASLTLPNVSTNQSGTYAVTVSNATGSANASATLKILVPVRIIVQPQPPLTVTNAGATITYAVVATGDQPLNYQWGFKESGETNSHLFPVQTNPSLTLTNVTPANSGDYFVLVSNPVSLEPSVSVTVKVLSPALHPADTKEPFWRLTIDEVVAYAAAWKQPGATWPLEPSPIPLNYMVRAGALWKGGELYTYDPSIPTAPEWWVNVKPGQAAASLASVRPMSLDLNTAKSEMAFRPSAGTPATVRITATPGRSTSAYAVEDQPPAGWLVCSVNEGGVFDPVNGKVKWGLFMDNRVRTLSYEAMPPAGASDLAAFHGAANFDGLSEVTISGQRQIVVQPPRLMPQQLTVQPGRALQMRLDVPVGIRVVVEASADLLHWETVSDLISDTSTINVEDPSGATARSRFYRVKYLPQ